MSVKGSNVVGLDLRALIRISNVPKDWVAARTSAHHIDDVQIVEGVRSLKPGPRVVEIQMNRIVGCKAAVDAVKEVDFVTFVMEDGKLGTIKEPAGVQTIDFDEVSPVLAAVGKIEASGRGAERPVGRSYASVRSSRALPRTGGYVDDEAGLSTIFGGRGSRNRLNRLDRIRRNLIGEHLALLIGDRLSVYRKRVRGVVAKTMEKTLGIGHGTGRSPRD